MEEIGGYRLMNLMMTSESSQVWEVVKTSDERRYAMKLLLREHVASAEHRRNLLRDAAVGNKTGQQHNLRIIEVNPDPRQPYVVFEMRE